MPFPFLFSFFLSLPVLPGLPFLLFNLSLPFFLFLPLSFVLLNLNLRFSDGAIGNCEFAIFPFSTFSFSCLLQFFLRYRIVLSDAIIQIFVICAYPISPSEFVIFACLMAPSEFVLFPMAPSGIVNVAMLKL
jgi:hypothetical protein